MFVRRFAQLAVLACAALFVPVTAHAQQPTAKRAAKAESKEAKAEAKETKAQEKAEKADMKLTKSVTARCGDSTWSTAASQQGACSRHNGVATWFGKAPRGTTARCSDGSYWTNEQTQGACSGHGGVAYWSKKGAAARAKKG